MGGFLFTNFQFCEVDSCDLQITQTFGARSENIFFRIKLADIYTLWLKASYS